MYKIYINDTPLLLTPPPETGTVAAGETHLLARYPGKSKFLLHYVDMLEHTRRWESIQVYSADPDALWKDFLQLYELREMAGILVRDPDGRILLIRTEDHSGFPVGMVASGADPQAVAGQLAGNFLGAGQPTDLKALDTTYHTLREGRRRILYRTHWFQLAAAGRTAPVSNTAAYWLDRENVPDDPLILSDRLKSLLQK